MTTHGVRRIIQCGFVAAIVSLGGVVSSPLPATAELPPPEPPNARTLFTPVVPARVLDTRATGKTVDGLGLPGARLGDGAALDVSILGRGGVPATGVSAVVLNVTVTNPTASSYLTLWPAQATKPTASNLNFTAGQTVPNLVVAKLGAGGRVSIFNAVGNVDVIADVAGYFPESDDFVPVVPARVLETRPSQSTIDSLGKFNGPLGAASTLDVKVLGRGGVPTGGVDAVVLNVTATNVTVRSFLTVWPTGALRPTASNLNLAPGRAVPNLVVAKVGVGGKVSVYNDVGSTDVIADVAGYFPTGGAFVAIQPARIYETRPGKSVVAGGENRGVRLGLDETVEVKVTGLAGVPDDFVSAVVLNVTAVAPSAQSYLTVWPRGVDRPQASSLNMVEGTAVPNLVVAKVGADGKVNIYNRDGSTDVIVDVAGYFQSEVGLVIDVAMSERSTCALDDLGRVNCWGETGWDPLPTSPPTPWTFPTPLNTFDDAVDLATGIGHTCVIRQAGTVWCWASPGISGTAGNGSTNGVWPAVRVDGIENAVRIDAGVSTTCALEADGVVTCWGSEFQSSAPNGGRPRVVPGLVDVVDIAVGDWSACALHVDGRVSCWGRLGSTGVLGDGSGTNSATPRFVANLDDADSIVVDGLRACATQVTGGAVCWGNSFLGDNSTGRSLIPVAVVDAITGEPADDILQIGGGDDYGCALRFDDQVYCWGSEFYGGLGLAPSADFSTGALTNPVDGLAPVIAIFPGRFHMCALTDDLALSCWGFNSLGQVGNGTFDTQTEPKLVLAET